MSGQPFSKIGADGNYAFGTDILGGREHLTALVTTAIAGWSSVQAFLGHTFAELIGGKTPVTMSMYAAFDSFAVQRQMLLTAAKELLPERHYEVFRLTLKVVEAAGIERHRFAHWLWGISTDPKFSTKILLLVDPRHSWKVRVANIRHWRRPAKNVLWQEINQPRLDPSEIRAYTAADLGRVCRQMEVAARLAAALSDLVRAKPKQRLLIRRALLAQPQIRQARDVEFRRETKTKKAPPKPPRLSSRARREAALARRKEQSK